MYLHVFTHNLAVTSCLDAKPNEYYLCLKLLCQSFAVIVGGPPRTGSRLLWSPFQVPIHLLYTYFYEMLFVPDKSNKQKNINSPSGTIQATARS